MATVTQLTPRATEGHAGLCAQLVGGTHTVLVRRQVEMPYQYQHKNSRATRLQRARFSKAAKDYYRLPYYAKRYWQERMEFI